MTKIIKYQTKENDTRYKFRLYGGIDEKTGKQCYIKRMGFISEREAQDTLDKLKYEIKNGLYFNPVVQMHFKEVYQEWLEQYQNTVKTSTFVYTKNNIEHNVVPLLGSYYVDKITLYDCQRAINKIFQKIPSAINLYHSYLTRILNYAKKLGRIKVKYALEIILPKQRDKIEKDNKFYTKDELNKYLKVIKEYGLKQYVLFRTLAYSGMRIGELLALVSFMSNTVRVNKTVAKMEHGKYTIQNPKTKSSNRLINMDHETMKILTQWKKQNV